MLRRSQRNHATAAVAAAVAATKEASVLNERSSRRQQKDVSSTNEQSSKRPKKEVSVSSRRGTSSGRGKRGRVRARDAALYLFFMKKILRIRILVKTGVLKTEKLLYQVVHRRKHIYTRILAKYVYVSTKAIF